MKRLHFLLVCCVILAMISILPSSAQDLSEEMIRVISDNLDNFFPLASITEPFETKGAAVRGNIGPETATESGTANGTRNLLLYANPDEVTEYGFIEKPNSGNLKNFYYSMDVTRNDLYPGDGGGCFIGYMNEFIPGISAEEPVESVYLIVSDAIYLEIRGAEETRGTRTKLADLTNDRVNLLIIRLTGETLFYADGEFIGNYSDGKKGPFQLRYGNEAFVTGEVVDCSFDNLTVRKVVP